MDILDFFWTFYLNHLSPLWGYFFTRKEGKEFGYFPFEELPPVRTQVIEEVIECEIGNLNIQHTDPVEINMDIHLPLRVDKLVKLQESDPHANN